MTWKYANKEILSWRALPESVSRFTDENGWHLKIRDIQLDDIRYPYIATASGKPSEETESRKLLIQFEKAVFRKVAWAVLFGILGASLFVLFVVGITVYKVRCSVSYHSPIIIAITNGLQYPHRHPSTVLAVS